jgi:hypothetical protein
VSQAACTNNLEADLNKNKSDLINLPLVAQTQNKGEQKHCKI